MSKITEKLARPGRTAGQGGLAFAIVEVVDSFGADFTTRQYGALLLLLTLVVSFIQVSVEDGLGKAVLRTIPAPAQAEVLSTVDDDVEEGKPVQTDNRPRDEDGEQLPFADATEGQWSGREMR